MQISISNQTVLKEYTLNPSSFDVFHSQCCIDNVDYTFSRLVNQWNWEESPVTVNGQSLGPGTDPRAFDLNGVPAAHVIFREHMTTLVSMLYFKDGDNWNSIRYNMPPGLKTGKNWAPFVYNADLYFIHEMSPFRVLKATGDEVSVVFDQLGNTEVMHLDNYTVFRGGGNGLQINDTLVMGFGHTNRSPLQWYDIIHRPFAWAIDMSNNTADITELLDFSWDNNYRIIDPTCFFKKGNQYYLMTVETEKIWIGNDNQRGRCCVYNVDFN